MNRNVVFIPSPTPWANLAPFHACAPWLDRRHDNEEIPADTCIGILFAKRAPIAMCPACNRFMEYMRGENQ